MEDARKAGTSDGAAVPPDRFASPRIRVLPAEVANRIAAGEVVERPASVVKELVENSLDAGASEVAVKIEQGGQRLIAVRDDGLGMSREEARLSLERHATSKLARGDDLFAIDTLGFRGEALPSIASVSRFQLTTRRRDDLEGTAIEVVGGGIGEVRPTACPAGTEVTVRDLFFNTPARLKFLKTEPTERRHIQMWLARLALGHPDVYVRLDSDGRSLIDAPACTDLRERVDAVLGGKTAEQLYPLPEGYQRWDIRLDGLFGSPDTARRTSQYIFTFINGRFVRDRRILAAVSVAYQGLVQRGYYPQVVLRLQMPTQAVDVNVHPTKTEVRFHQPDLVFRTVRRALLEGLAETPWVPAGDGVRRLKIYTLRDEGSDGVNSEAGDAASDAAALPGQAGQSAASGPEGPLQESLPGLSRLQTGMTGGWWTSGPDRERLAREASRNVWPPPEEEEAGHPLPGYFSSLHYIGTIGRLYLLCQDGEGLVVIDQHAAHERVTFERLRGLYGGHHREVQPLLLPLHLELGRLRAETMGESLAFFARVGFEIEPFSEDSFVLRAVPAVLVGAHYRRLVVEALDELAQYGHSERLDEAVDAVLSRMACHGSVRAGDRVEPAQARALFDQMDQIDFRANCPHGRPVYFRMTWDELEKRFERR